MVVGPLLQFSTGQWLILGTLTALYLFALVAGLYVLRDTFFEAVERIRSKGKKKQPDEGESEEVDSKQIKPPKGPTPGDRIITEGMIVCGECGEENPPEFEYCGNCAERL